MVKLSFWTLTHFSDPASDLTSKTAILEYVLNRAFVTVYQRSVWGLLISGQSHQCMFHAGPTQPYITTYTQAYEIHCMLFEQQQLVILKNVNRARIYAGMCVTDFC